MKRETRGPKTKTKTCLICEKDLHSSSFFKKAHICIDCLAAGNGGVVKCGRCANDRGPSEYEISQDKSYLKATCESCCQKMVKGRRLAKQLEVVEKETCYKCDKAPVDVFKGRPICRDHLSPPIEPLKITDLLTSRGVYGSAMAMCEEQPKTYEITGVSGRRHGGRR